MKRIYLFLSAFITIILILSIGVYHYYKYQVEVIKTDAQHQLKAIAQLKISQIVSWDKERLIDTKIISQDPFFVDDSDAWTTSKVEYNYESIALKRFANINSDKTYSDIIILNPKGEFILSLNKKSEAIDSTLNKYVKQSIYSKSIVKTDLYKDQFSGKIRLDYIAPILGKNNKLFAIVVFRVDPNDFLYPLIDSWPTPSKSAETVIVKREGDKVVYLNKVRNQDYAPLTYKRPLTNKKSPSVNAALGYTGVFEGTSNHGVDVLSYIEPIPNTLWVMVAKINRSEIYANLYFREKVMISLITLLILITILVSLTFYKNHQSKTFKQLFVKEKELREYHEEFRTTLYSIGDGVITTDEHGLIKQMNPVAEALTGWKESEALGKKLLEIYNVIDENTKETIENPVDLVLKKGEPVTLENHFILTSRQGKDIPIGDCGSPIKDEKGNIVGVVLVFRDQTEERFAEKLTNARLDLIDFAARNNLETFLQKAIDEVCNLTKSQIGFYHFVDDDQKTLTLQTWSTRTLKEFCKAEGKGLHYNIDDAGVWVDCVKLKKPVIHNDYPSLENKKGLPKGHAPITRELVVPIVKHDKVFAVLGVGNKEDNYTERDIEIVSFLSDVAWEITERKRIEEAVQISEARLRRAEIASKAGNWELHLDSNRMIVSEGACLVYGIESKESTFEEIKKVPLPDYRPILDTALDNLIKYDQPYDLEFKIKTVNTGEIKYIHSIAQYDSERKILFGVINDITRQKQGEQELAKISRQNQLILDSAAEGILGLDINGNHTFINRSALSMLGFSEEELLGKNSHSLWHHSKSDGNGHSEHDCLIYSTLNDGTPHSSSDEVFWRKDGTSFPISYSTMPIVESEKLIGAVVTFTDITEKKRIENEIKEQEAFVINLLEILPIPVFYKNVKGEYINVNKSFTKFFGKSKEELKGLNVFDLYPRDLAEFYYQKDNELIKNPGIQVYESKYINSVGVEYDVIVHKVVFRNSKNEVAGLVGAILDITEIKQNQNNLIRLNQQLKDLNKTKDKMISIISHDLRSPFTGILGFIELLGENILTWETTKAENIVQLLHSTAKSTYDLLENLLSWAKSQTGQISFKPSNIELQSILDSIIKTSNSLSIIKNIRLIYSCPTTTFIYADKDTLSLVLRNLITNAIKFTKRGGTIEVRVVENINYTKIQVKDDGVGMDETIKSKLFKLDEKISSIGTNDERGSGLGLILCKEFTERNNGTIEFESAVNKGTTFTLKFPKHNQDLINNG